MRKISNYVLPFNYHPAEARQGAIDLAGWEVMKYGQLEPSKTIQNARGFCETYGPKDDNFLSIERTVFGKEIDT